ncbi:MAG: hypothetical protein NC084_05185 [Bacteroides sp.]|nr:hypothetical protein [Roseburia sp.]MCM1462091.1 hypothetical protein [Bacteroides sp.]
MAKTRLCVLFGGATKDHKLSLQSAFSVLNGLSREKYDVTPIGITRAGRWLYFPGDYEEIADGTWEQNSDCSSAIISPDPLHAGVITILNDGTTAFKRIDAVFSVLHGKYGEGGRIQGLLKLAKLPYTDCDPETANCCMDKILTHTLLRDAGVPVPRYAALERSDLNDLDRITGEIGERLGYPLYVSASSCSSSISANLAHNEEEFKHAAKIAFSHHHTAIAEEYLSGRSLCCIVTGGSYDIWVSSIGETIKTPLKKPYVSCTAEFDPHARLTPTEEERLRTLALRAYKALGLSGYAKMNFFLCGDELLLRRINTIPGFSEESALPLLMKASGYDYSETLDLLIAAATEG